MEENTKLKFTKKKQTPNTVRLIAIVFSILTIIVVSFFIEKKGKTKFISSDPELLRAITYEELVESDKTVSGTDNIRFSAFFLRDINGDGYAERIKGTCKELGKQDKLYIELNVQTEGYLKNGKIEIGGKNFYLQTALPRDEEYKTSYIGENTKIIEFNDIENGTQKLIMGYVRSGDYTSSSTTYSAIGANAKNYSREDNKIILTGTYVDGSGNETAIRKECPLTIDWYGTAACSIYNTSQTYYNIENRVDETNGKLTLDFTVSTQETKNILNIYSNYVEGTIPELNGYAPIEVICTSSNTEFTYDQTTRMFTLTRTAVTREDGTFSKSVSRSNSYGIKVVYPIGAYEANGEENVRIQIPVKTYYECYNNPNTEFQNPYKTNISSSTITAYYRTPLPVVPPEPDKPIIYSTSSSVTIGKYVSDPNNNHYYVIPKTKPIKLYNGTSSEENDDTYIVRWYAFTGTDKEYSNVVMKETKTGEEQKVDEFIKADSTLDSMEDLTSNVGIYFSGAGDFLKEDGYIKVYDESTDELLVTFTKNNWNNYSSSNPYRYELPVKHIRVETSATNSVKSLYVYNIKELDDELITGRYLREDFDNLKNIKTNLSVTMGDTYSTKHTHQARYEEPYSVATISLNKQIISTQITEENMKIKIEAETDTSKNQVKWANGSFIVKLPTEILTVEINDVTINNNSVSITSYEIVERNGEKCIKINTSNDNPQDFVITIDADITPDPRIATLTKTFDLYAYNENTTDYYYKGQDLYDVNDNSNLEELVNKDQVSINLVAPNTLLTNQTASEFDESGTIIISPEIADLKPVYDNEVQEKETVKIGVQVRNNYNGTISEAMVLGKIPFEGNTYVVSGKNLNSTFTTNITETGIEVPENLQDIVTVYYSENTNPNRNLDDSLNGWTLAENITDWTKVRTYLIDFGDSTISPGVEYIFYYTVEIPFGVEFNETSYSHHGVFFSLNTDEGKFRTSTEPNRIGIRIADKFYLELDKYQTGKTKLVPGATYKISKLTDNGEIEESQTAITDNQGKIVMANLYAEKVYQIEEIKTPADYELSEDIIKIVGHIDRADGSLTIEKLQGAPKETPSVIKREDEDYRANVKVEDEAKATLKITKLEQGTETPIRGVRYKITGTGFSETGRTITTNINGEVTLRGLKIGETYTLQETKAEGYYLASEPVVFVIANNEGTYEVQVISGEIKESSITLNDEIPTVNVTLEDEKIPTYNLVLNKVEKGNSEVKLEGAKFKLYKETKEMGSFITNENGQITIEGLYQYVDGKPENASYTLKEVLAPEGYAKVSNIIFKVSNDGENLVFEGNRTFEYTSDGNTLNLIVPDSPSFKLIKKDGETTALLPNVKFAIYDVSDGEVPARNSKGEIIGTKEIIDGREYYTVTTNENGEITADLPEGLYKAVEVEAPVQYDISDNTEYFGIGKSRENIMITYTGWAESFGAEYSEYLTDVMEDFNGDYIAIGRFSSRIINLGDGISLTNHGTSDTSDGLIIKYDNDGKIKNVKNVGGDRNDYIKSILCTEDGGYIVGGFFYSSRIELENGIAINHVGSTSNANGMIIKYNSEGEVVFAKVTDIINSMSGTSDGGLIVCGSNKITKYNSQIEEEWNTPFGGTLYSISETSDGGYIIGGSFSANSINLGNGIVIEKYDNTTYQTDGVVIKCDSTGEIEWAKSAGGTESEDIYSVIETSDGGFLAGGAFNGRIVEVGNNIVLERYNNINLDDAMIIKYDIQGNTEWGMRIGAEGIDSIYSLIETSDGGFLAVGEFKSSSSSSIGCIDFDNGVRFNSSGFAVKFNIDREAEWVIEGTYVIGQKVIETTENEYIIVGNFNGEKGQNIDLGNGIGIKNNSDRNSNGGAMYYDGLITKYTMPSQVIQVAIKDGKTLGGTGNDKIAFIESTEDGGYIAKGNFYGTNIDIGNNIFINSTDFNDIYEIKYNSTGLVEYVEQVNSINSIQNTIDTEDGGYVAIDNTNQITKYTSEGNIEWTKTIGTKLECIIKCQDGGFIIGGNFSGKSIDIGKGIKIRNHSTGSYQDGMVIKLDENGYAEWGVSIGGTGNDYITSVAELTNGKVVAGGYFNSSTIILDDDKTITNHGSTSTSDAMLITISPEMGVPEVSELTVENQRKNLKITTDINEIDGIKGGTISGEDLKAYETIKYGDGSTSEIKMTPDADYEIIGITVNDEEYPFTSEEDGTFTMPQFENITEDKHIVVTFSLKDNKITINKKDSSTNETIPNVKFKLDQLEERPEPTNIIEEINGNSQDYYYIANKETDEITDSIGTLTNNGQTYTTVEITDTEITTALGELTNNNTYYFVDNGDGAYVPTNSKTYQLTNEGSTGIQGVTANSYIPIDLSGLTGNYAVVVNARVSSESNYDFGYATLNQSTTAPAYGTTEGRFMYISGTVTNKDYISSLMDGGEIYYLHLGYRKDGSGDTNEDQVVINSIKVYEAQEVNKEYNFTNNEGKYESTNQNQDSTVSNSYIPIDLTGKEGRYELIVNAEVSSQSSYDYGYATITSTADRPAYNASSGRFIYISGTQAERDYSTVLEGGQMYYLHFGYYKDASTSTGDDKFIINSVNLYKQTLYQYNFTQEDGKYESSNQGKDNTVCNSYIPIDLTTLTGKYNLSVSAEISTQSGDYGYATITENTTRPLYSDTTGRIIYITGTQSAQDYSTVLQAGKMYYLHLGYYKDGVANTTGDDKFAVNSIEVTLNDSELYHTEITTNSEGQAITQIPFGKYAITEIEAPDIYIIPEEPTVIEFRSYDGAQHEFTLTNNKYSKVTVHHYIKDTTEQVAEDEELFGIPNEDYTTIPKMDLDRYELEKDVNDDYVVPSNATGKFTEDEIEVTYYYVERKNTLVVHHYIENTETPVPLLDGTEALDFIGKELEGTEYTTSAIEDSLLAENYELAEIPENANGTYSEETTVVTYYYKEVERTLTINKYSEDGLTPLTNVEFEVKDNTNTILGDITSNGQKYLQTIADETKNYNTYLGDIVNSGTYYFVDNGDGTLVPTNGKTWQLANGESSGKGGTTANSYIPVNLNGLTGKYVLVVNARISSENNYDYGFATLNQSTTNPAYSTSTGRFLYIAGTQANKNYTSNIINGGSTYYLHLGYRKDGSGDTGEDQIVINSINLYSVKEKEIAYDFEYKNGKYISNNIEKDNTVANSYVKIDLTGKEGEYNLVVNAEVSSQSGYDYGYATVTENIDRPAYNLSTGRFIYISGIQAAKDYTTVLTGGKVYYLHLGYYKNASTSSGDDCFTINSIKVGDEVLTKKLYKTDTNGRIELNLKVGNYTVKETETLYGYKLPDDVYLVSIDKSVDSREISVTNEKKKGTVTVHHYLEGTTTPVILQDNTEVEEEVKTDDVGKTYATKVPDNINTKYELVSEPENSSGEYIDGNIEVNYYYRLKESTVLVHYYKQGTEESISDDVIITKTIDSRYETVEADDIPDYYELVGAPLNKIGTVTEEQTVVIYYYRLKKYSYIVNYLEKNNETNILSEAKTVDNIEYGTEITSLGEIIDITGYNYDSVNKEVLTIGMDLEENIINVYYTRSQINYLVEYYYDGIKDDTKTVTDSAEFGSEVTTYTDKNITGYKLDKVEGTPLTITENPANNVIKVYYVKDNFGYTVEYYYDGTKDNTKTVTSSAEYGSQITTYTDKNITGYKLDHVEGLPLTITENPASNIIKVYYVKDNFGYSVEYYYDGTKDDTKTVTSSAEFGSEVTTYTDKNITGYKLDKVEGTPLTITENTAINVIKVYYVKDNFGYTVEYYYDGIKDDTKTETGIAEYGTNITTYTDKNITGYKIDIINNLPLTITENPASNIIKVYYIKDNFGYTVEYYYDGIKDDTKTVTSSAEYGSKITTYTDKNIIGYKLDHVEGLPLTITEVSANNVIKVYYVKDSFGYTVEYYYDGTKDDAKTVTRSAEYGSQITTYENKNITGYKLEKTEGLPLTITEVSANNIIKVYYAKDNFGYTVEYYYDGTKDDAKTVTSSAEYGSQITTYTDKNITGYKLDHTEGLPLTITENTAINVIKVYYVKDNFGYTVEYYYDGTKDNTKTVTSSAEYGSQITTYENKNITGYKLEKTEGLPLTITEVLANNIIKVYYVKDSFGYTVEYYYDGTKDDAKTVTSSAEYGVEITTYTDKNITGYILQQTEGLPLTITENPDNNIIKVYYILDEGNTKTLSYTVEYYKDGIKQEDDTITKEEVVQVLQQDKISIERSLIENRNKYTGYKLNNTDPEDVPNVVNTGTVIKVYYVKDSFGYTVEYYYDGEIDSTKTVNSSAEYGTEITTYTNKNITGYKLDHTEGLPLTITEISANNVIKVYYSKDSFGYSVEYYYNGTKDDTKTVTSSAEYGSEITTYTDKNITGYKLDKVEGTPLTITENPANNVIKVYYVKDNFGYTVEYYYDGTKDDTKTVTDSAVFESQITTYTDKNITGYKLDHVEGLPLTITEIPANNVIKVYYVKDSFGYSVEYYYDGIKDDTKTETGIAEYGTNITTYTDKNITGYKIDIINNLPLTITENPASNIIKVYYIKDNFGYTVEYYYDGIKDDTKTVTSSAEYGSKITTYTDKNIIGYKLDHVEGLPLTITENPASNIIKVYYVKDNFGYSIEYYYDGIKDDTKTVTSSAEFGSEVTTYTDKNITGYKLDHVEGLPLTITENPASNIIKVYYVKDNFGYSVEYYYDGTKDDTKTVTSSAEYGSEITTYTDKNITGYKLDHTEGLPLTITENPDNNIIKVYYILNDADTKIISYTVEYYKDGIKQEDDTKVKTKEIQVLEQETLEVERSLIENNSKYTGYKLINTDPETVPNVVTDGTVIKVYYEKDNFKYTVEYYYNGEIDSSKTEEAEAEYLSSITTYTDKIKTGYKLDRTEGLPLIITENLDNNIIKVYYVPNEEETKTLSYTVEYYKDGEKQEGDTVTRTENIQILQPDEIEIDRTLIENNSKYPGYTIVRLDPETVPDVVTDGTTIKVYYIKGSYNYKVNYYYDGEIDLTKTETISAEYGEEINEFTDNSKYGYKLDNTENLPLIIGNENDLNVINIYYVRKDAYIEVKYIDKYTNESISESEKIEKKVFDKYDVSEKIKELEGYHLVEQSDSLTGTLEEENEPKIFYYAKNTKIIVKYLEKDNTPLDDSDNLVLVDENSNLYGYEEEGYEGKEYTTIKKDILGYTFVESTENTSGQMEREPITIVYYYTQNTKVKVEHIDKNTDEILDEKLIEGKVGDIVNTEAKDIEGYVLVEKPDEEQVEMTKEEVTVKYYYAKVSEGVIEKHIDVKTDEILYNELHRGNEGDTYKIEPKEFEGYDLVEEKLPENAEGTFGIEGIEVKYYYIRKTKVRVEYIDETSGEKLSERLSTDYEENVDNEFLDSTEYILGHEGDTYEAKEKKFTGYDIVQSKYPENKTGTMEVTVDEEGNVITEIVVKFYYNIKAKVEQEHIDEKTGEVLYIEYITGFKNEEYETHPKEIEGYDLVIEKIPENAEGTMGEDTTLVKYYYIRKAKVVVSYVDGKTGKEIPEKAEIAENVYENKDSTEYINGHEGDSYETEEKEFTGYNIDESNYPENAKGTMDVTRNADGTVDITTYVKYSYVQKEAKVVIKYVDEASGKEIAEQRTITGKEGDSYKAEKMAIQGYEYKRVEGSEEGTMKQGENVVVYYYAKVEEKPADNNKPTESEKPTGNNNVPTTNSGVTATETKTNTEQVTTIPATLEPVTKPNVTKSEVSKEKQEVKVAENKEIVDVKSGDIIPVVTISTILVLLIANILLLKENKKKLDRLEKRTKKKGWKLIKKGKREK